MLCVLCRKQCIKECQQLEEENDEQKIQLNELIEKEKAMALTLQKYTKENQNLLSQLEAVEIEVKLHLIIYLIILLGIYSWFLFERVNKFVYLQT